MNPSYEPKGKTKLLIDAMRAQGAQAVWSTSEAAAVMGVQNSALPAFLDAAMRNQVLYRRITSGRSEFSLTPFPAAPEPTAEPLRHAAAPAWAPKPMIAPRAGTDHPVKPITMTPRKGETEVPIRETPPPKRETQRPVPAVAPAPCPPPPSPAPQPVPSTPSPPAPELLQLPVLEIPRFAEPVIAAAPAVPVDDFLVAVFPVAEPPQPTAAPAPAVCDPRQGEPEAVPFDAWRSARTGALILTGLVLDADGDAVLERDQVEILRRVLA